MSVAAQLYSSDVFASVNYDAEIVDFCWPERDDNAVAREKISFLLFHGYKKLNPNWQINLEKFIPGKFMEFNYTHGDSNNPTALVTLSYELDEAILFQSIQIHNLSQNEEKFNFFTDARIDFASNRGRDTAVYFPEIKGIVHYEGTKYLGICSTTIPKSYSCQDPLDYAGLGALPDKNLELSKNPVSTGKTNSSLKYELTVECNSYNALTIAYITGSSMRDIVQKHKTLTNTEHTQNLLVKNSTTLPASFNAVLEKLELNQNEITQLELILNTSREVLKSLHSKSGGIIAAVDSAFYKNGATDDYSYCWPRDAAMILLAQLTDYKNNPSVYDGKSLAAEAIKSFDFLAKAFNNSYTFQHRYRMDATPGSSWHSWVGKNGEEQLPLQVDQAALVIISYLEFLETFPAEQSLLMNAALKDISSLLIRTINSDFLHLPCYNLWENDIGVFPTSHWLIQRALICLVDINSKIKANGQNELFSEQVARDVKIVAEKMALASVDNLIDKTHGFYRSIQTDSIAEKVDHRTDSSVHILWQFAKLDPNKEEIRNTVIQISEKIATGDGGYARFENDHYLSVEGEFTGNPWYISTLWQAQYFLVQGNYLKAQESIKWILKHAEQTGILPEMADPRSGYALSIRPLGWSHAAFLNLLNWDYVVK